MYQKFIITDNGVLKFGCVYLHYELLDAGEQCPYGGGLWKIDAVRHAVILYGRSFDFGKPDFNALRRIDWSGIDGEAHALLYAPQWPNEECLLPVVATGY